MDLSDEDEYPALLQDTSLIFMSPLPPSSPLTPLAHPINDLDSPPQNVTSRSRGAHDRSSPASISVATAGPLSPIRVPSGSESLNPRTPIATRTTPIATLSSNGLDYSTPIRGSPETKKKIIRAKGQKKRAKTRQQLQLERDEIAAENAAYHAAIASQTAAHALGNIHNEGFTNARAPDSDEQAAIDPVHIPREEVFEQALGLLKAHGLSWGDLVLYISDPTGPRLQTVQLDARPCIPGSLTMSGNMLLERVPRPRRMVFCSRPGCPWTKPLWRTSALHGSTTALSTSVRS